MPVSEKDLVSGTGARFMSAFVSQVDDRQDLGLVPMGGVGIRSMGAGQDNDSYADPTACEDALDRCLINGAALGAAQLVGIHDRVHIGRDIKQARGKKQRQCALDTVIFAQMHR